MKRRILRSLIALVSGAMLGQLLLVLATPILSRIYDPAAFGAFSALVAITSVLGPVAALRFDAGIILPDQDDKARGLLRLALVTSALASLASALAVWGLSTTIVGRAWALIPFAPLWAGVLVFATSVFTVLSQAALRRREYGVLARRSPFQSAGTVVGQVGLGLAGAGALGLVAGFVLGRFFGFVPLFRTVRPLLARPNIDSYRGLVKEYRRLPLSLASAALVSSLGAQIPLLLVASYFGEAAAGEYGMAQRLIGIPATLLGASVAQVFGAELASLVRGNLAGARRLYLQASARLSVIGAGVAITIVLLAPPILPLVLGEGWGDTAAIAQAISLVAAASLVGSPLSQVYTVYQSWATIVVDLIRIALLGCAWVGVLLADATLIGASWALSIGQTAGYIVLWSYGLRLVSRRETP